jgi:hypothetical protein
MNRPTMVWSRTGALNFLRSRWGCRDSNPVNLNDDCNNKWFDKLVFAQGPPTIVINLTSSEEVPPVQTEDIIPAGSTN